MKANPRIVVDYWVSGTYTTDFKLNQLAEHMLQEGCDMLVMQGFSRTAAMVQSHISLVISLKICIFTIF
jgi:hypothetical protein